MEENVVKQMNMRRICIFTEKWASGGIESFLTSVLTHIDRSCMEIDIVAACLEKSIFTPQLIERGICFYELSGSRNSICENRKLFLRILKKRRYDAIHLNAFHGGSLYYLSLAKKVGVPVRIAHSHNTALRKGKFYLPKMAIHELSSRLYTSCATDAWACSDEAAEFLFRGKIPFQVIPNGFDTEKFKFSNEGRETSRKKLGLTNQILVGHVGRLCWQKNQTFLLNVFAEFLKVEPNSKLLLVGEGEDRGKLEEKIISLHLEDSVIFGGTTDSVAPLLWAMDIFVFPSIFEGLGIAAVEAQASGLPVICSDTVPNMARILPSAHKVSLNCMVDEWVAAMESSLSYLPEREKCAAIVRESGFDIANVAKSVEQSYLKK